MCWCHFIHRDPLFIAEGLDVFLFSSIRDAERALEGIDVASGVYRGFDAEGQRLVIEASDVHEAALVEIGTVKIADLVCAHGIRPHSGPRNHRRLPERAKRARVGALVHCACYAALLALTLSSIRSKPECTVASSAFLSDLEFEAGQIQVREFLTLGIVHDSPIARTVTD